MASEGTTNMLDPSAQGILECDGNKDSEIDRDI